MMTQEIFSIKSIRKILSTLKNRKKILKFVIAASTIYASQKLIRIYLCRYSAKGNSSGKSKKCDNGSENNALEFPAALRCALPANQSSGARRQRPKLFPGAGRKCKDFARLLKIMIPGIFSKEAGILYAHSAILFCRTLLTIYVASIEGGLMKAMVRVDVPKFIWNLSKFLFIAIPATFVNSMIRYFESHLGMAFRTRLVEYAYRKYFTNETYYRVTMLDGRLTNADQCLTEDITIFSTMVARLYSQLTKPILDIAIILFTLYRYARRRGATITSAGVLAVAITVATFSILKGISPKFGKLVAEEASRKGHLRYIHGRLITNAEEISFYGGFQVEHHQLLQAYRSLCSQMSLIYRKRILYVMMEQFLMKYIWTAGGFVMIALPGLTIRAQRKKLLQRDGGRDDDDDGMSQRASGIAFSRNLMSSCADAMERLLSSFKDVTELAGYMARVSEMLYVFDEVADGRYQRTALPPSPQMRRDSASRWDITRIEGRMIEQNDLIDLQDVPIITPTGDVIVESLSIEIRRGMHLLISGPNGCGKSSLFRILGGLWPVYKGTLKKPPVSALFYIPQRPYLSLGTLRDQIIYPDSVHNMLAKGYKDEDLEEILRIVHLSYVVEREGGWSARNDWMDVFSGGEKQRIGLARIFYHRPTFAILDECTSAISIDVEGAIYQAAKAYGITLLTVTHRPSLWKYHTHILQFDGAGAWSFGPLEGSLDHRLSLAEEKQRIESNLSSVPQMRTRLREICVALGDDSAQLQD